MNRRRLSAIAKPPQSRGWDRLGAYNDVRRHSRVSILTIASGPRSPCFRCVHERQSGLRHICADMVSTVGHATLETTHSAPSAIIVCVLPATPAMAGLPVIEGKRETADIYTPPAPVEVLGHCCRPGWWGLCGYEGANEMRGWRQRAGGVSEERRARTSGGRRGGRRGGGLRRRARGVEGCETRAQQPPAGPCLEHVAELRCPEKAICDGMCQCATRLPRRHARRSSPPQP